MNGKTWAVAIALLVASSTSAFAQFRTEPVPPLSLKRVGIGLGGGVNLYGTDAGTALGEAHGMMGAAAVSYSLGRSVSVGTSYEYDFDHELGVVGFGPRLLLIGNGQGDYTQLAGGKLALAVLAPFGGNLLSVAGTAALGGTLSVAVTGAPAVNGSYRLVAAPTRVGQFASTQATNVPNWA